MTARWRAVALGLALASATAHEAAAVPPAVEAVAVQDRTGQRVPFDLRFTEADGRRVKLGDFFGDGKPVLLVMAYVRCSMLCSLVLRGTVRAVRELDMEPGRDYRIITVSIDPAEQATVAAERRRQLVADLGPGPAGLDERARWTYLIGAENPIRALADAIGFGYAWDERTEQFAHPAVLFVLAPDGTLVRTLQGIDFDPGELGAALRSAERGLVPAPSSVAEAVLRCFRFDPAARIHREQIRTTLRVGASILSIGLASLVLGLFVWERRRSRRP
jgi:protein SCO1